MKSRSLHDWTDFLIEERLEEILDECQELKDESLKKVEPLMAAFHGDDKSRLDDIIEEIMSDNFCANKICYGAGFEDGVRLTRKLLTLSFERPHYKTADRRASTNETPQNTAGIDGNASIPDHTQE